MGEGGSGSIAFTGGFADACPRTSASARAWMAASRSSTAGGVAGAGAAAMSAAISARTLANHAGLNRSGAGATASRSPRVVFGD